MLLIEEETKYFVQQEAMSTFCYKNAYKITPGTSICFVIQYEQPVSSKAKASIKNTSLIYMFQTKKFQKIIIRLQ